MKTLGYYNGTYDELDRMMVPMNDRVCYFGDGVYDAGPCRNYHIFAIDEHIDRFFNNAALLEIRMPCTKAELKALLQELVQKLDTGDLFVYYQVTRGTGMRDHPFTEGTGNLWVTLKPAAPPQLAEKIRLITVEDTRFYHCNIKTLNLIPSVMASQRAKEKGCQEAVFHRGDRVTECAHSNCHILKDGRLITAPLDNLILPGIARAHLINICEKSGRSRGRETLYRCGADGGRRGVGQLVQQILPFRLRGGRQAGGWQGRSAFGNDPESGGGRVFDADGVAVKA